MRMKSVFNGLLLGGALSAGCDLKLGGSVGDISFDSQCGVSRATLYMREDLSVTERHVIVNDPAVTAQLEQARKDNVYVRVKTEYRTGECGGHLVTGVKRPAP